MVQNEDHTHHSHVEVVQKVLENPTQSTQDITSATREGDSLALMGVVQMEDPAFQPLPMVVKSCA